MGKIKGIARQVNYEDCLKLNKKHTFPTFSIKEGMCAFYLSDHLYQTYANNPLIKSIQLLTTQINLGSKYLRYKN